MFTALFSFMPGIAAMDNVHPLFVHFPIALFSSFLLAEFLGVVLQKEALKSAASFTLYFGNILALIAVIAGFYAASTVGHDDAVHAIMERHEAFGVAVLIIATFLSLWRLFVRRRFSPKMQFLHLVLAFILTVVMAIGADLGGLMVYKHGVGGEAVRIERARDKKADLAHDEGPKHEHAGGGGHHHGE